MGKLWAILDAAGYQYAEESGADFQWTGRRLGELLTPDRDQPELQRHKFWVPDDSPWLGPRLLQMRQDWFKDAALSNHILRQGNWTFAPELTVTEYEPTRLADGTTYPANQWISIPEIPAGTLSLDGTDYDALADAMGVTFPDGMVTIAFAARTPLGTGPRPNLNDADYHPHLNWNPFPEPAGPLVFGFADLALILWRNTVHLLRTPNGDKQSWRPLKIIPLGANTNPWNIGAVRWALAAAGLVSPLRLDPRAISAFPVGPNGIYLRTGDGQMSWQKLRSNGQPGERLFDRGGLWWLGAAPGTPLQFQIQLCGYESADTNDITPTEEGVTQVLGFATGSQYKPTTTAQFLAKHYLHGNTADWVVAQTANSFSATDSVMGESVLINLNKSNGDPWNGDGTEWRGGVRIRLIPAGSGSYLAPWVKFVEVRFPPKLATRVATPLVLDDTYFGPGWGAQASLRDPEDKRLRIPLNAAGAALAAAAGLLQRDQYAVEIWEDADGDDVRDTLRVAGWATSGDVEEWVTENEDRAAPVLEGRIDGKGLLARVDYEPLFLPLILHPDSGDGHIEHTYVVAQTLKAIGGFDITDATKVSIATDPLAGTAMAQLPGTWGNDTDQVGHRTDAPWAMDWEETGLDYCDRIAREWRGWQFYEQLNGKVVYEPDTAFAILQGQSYAPAVTIYRGAVEAQAAGRPGQYFLTEGELEHSGPLANVIRLTGQQEDGGHVPHLVDRDTASVTDPGADNFVGHWIPKTFVSKLAVVQPGDRGALAIMGRVLLRRVARRRRRRKVVVPLAPWEFRPVALALGTIVQLKGRGCHIVIHLDVTCSHRDVYETRLVLERVPLRSTS